MKRAIAKMVPIFKEFFHKNPHDYGAKEISGQILASVCPEIALNGF
jgi:hypothetical protein